METLNAITSRRSVRAFTSEPVPEDKLEVIVRAGSVAASAGNRQPWAFITICKPRLIKALRALSPGMLSSPPAVIVICLDETLAMHNDDGKVDRMAWMDLGAAMENMLLAAHELGLGACPIGSFNEKAVIQLLFLPGNIKPALFLIVGVPEWIPEQPQKRSFDGISFYDRYGGPL